MGKTSVIDVRYSAAILEAWGLSVSAMSLRTFGAQNIVTEQDGDKNPRCVTYHGFIAKDEIFLKE